MSALNTKTSSLSLMSNPALVGAMWMVSSSLLTTYTTTSFLKYPPTKRNVIHNPQQKRPSTLPPSNQLTMMRFLGSLILGVALHPDFHVVKRCKATVDAMPDFLLPAFFLFVANLSNSVALDRIGISLTYTSKCAIPLITVLFTLLVDGTQALPNGRALSSLLPIAIGIAAASWNAPTVDWRGCLAALTSTTAQSALNVSSKKVLSYTGATGLQAQRSMVAIGLLLTVCYNQLSSIVLANKHGSSTQRGPAVSTLQQQQRPWRLTLAAVTAYHIEYVFSFLFVSLVSPVTYGACDAVRRLLIILAGRIMFGGHPLTRCNVGGILLALSGALGYSVATSTTTTGIRK